MCRNVQTNLLRARRLDEKFRGCTPGAPGSVLTGLDTPRITKKTCLSWAGNIKTQDLHIIVKLNRITKGKLREVFFWLSGKARGMGQKVKCLHACLCSYLVMVQIVVVQIAMTQNGAGPNSYGLGSDFPNSEIRHAC